jgi:hypothetical protein
VDLALNGKSVCIRVVPVLFSLEPELTHLRDGSFFCLLCIMPTESNQPLGVIMLNVSGGNGRTKTTKKRDDGRTKKK